jgi:hypothetical protein
VYGKCLLCWPLPVGVYTSEFICELVAVVASCCCAHRSVELTDAFEEAPAPAAAVATAPVQPEASTSSSSSSRERRSRSKRVGPKSREQRQADMAAAAADGDTARYALPGPCSAWTHEQCMARTCI